MTRQNVFFRIANIKRRGEFFNPLAAFENRTDAIIKPTNFT